MLTMYPAKVNSPITTITSAINDTDTNITVGDATVFPDAPNLAVIGTDEDAETVRYTAINGNDLTVERGFQGTAKAWDAETPMARLFTAYDHDTFLSNLSDHISEVIASDNVHGLRENQITLSSVLSTAGATNGIALGRDAKIGNLDTGSADGHIAIGYGADVQENSSFDRDETIAIGKTATATRLGVSLGASTLASAWGVALGKNANSGGNYSISIGMSADCKSSSSIGIGNSCTAFERRTLVMGEYAVGEGEEIVAIGRNAFAGNGDTGSGNFHTVIGNSASTHVDSTANYDYMTAIGANATATNANEGVLGVADGGAGTYNWKIPGNLQVSGELTIPARTSDPASPAVGSMWLRTDL